VRGPGEAHVARRRGADLAYVHTPGGYEVDFLARLPDGEEDLIQVCASLDDEVAREREVRALLDASVQHPRATRWIISLDIPPRLNIPPGITVSTAADWMLAGESRA
jgi:predicted AAA+ superfamily ATPase